MTPVETARRASGFVGTGGVLSGILGLSLAIQWGLYDDHLYTVSADESERTLLADRLSLHTAFEPSLWPPLPRIITGLALKISPNLVVTPRVVVWVVGMLTVTAVFMLARELFGSRTVALTAALLAVFIPQRLIVSVVPLADIFAYLFVVLGAAFLASWLARGRPHALLACATCFLLASAARYEVWYFNATLALYVAYRWRVRSDLSVRMFLASAGILVAFPCVWLVATYAQTRSLATLTFTGPQFIASNGHDLSLALRDNVAVLLLKDVVTQPVFWFALAGLVVLAVRQPNVRTYVLLLGAPGLLLAASMAATYAVPTAAPWRSDGLWLVLAVPFSAWAIFAVARRASASREVQAALVVLLAAVIVLPSVLRTRPLVHQGQAQAGALADQPLSNRLHAILHQSHRDVLLDAIGNLDYLNVLVASNAPDRFVLDVDADPVKVAEYAAQRGYYIRHRKTTIERKYLTDKFGLAHHLDLRRLHRRNVGYVLVEDPSFIAALDRNPHVVPEQSYGRWTLFDVA